jgi:replicative DNA helicase
LLVRIGIVARIRTVQQLHRPLSEVVVSGAIDQLRFLDVVGSFGPRVVPSERLRTALAAVSPNTNVDTLPREVFIQVRASMARLGISDRQMAALRGTAYGGSSHYAFSPSRATLASYASLLGDAGLLRQATNNLFWDRVAEMAPDGEEEVRARPMSSWPSTEMGRRPRSR